MSMMVSSTSISCRLLWIRLSAKLFTHALCSYLSNDRRELIAQYSRLSEEAARRERRAMWRVQRTRLDEARAQFFMHDRQNTQAILEKYPLGTERPPEEVLPPLPSAQQPLSELQPAEIQEAEAVSPPHDPSLPNVAPLTADPALISEHIDINDFLPKSPKPDSQLMDLALLAISSDLPQAFEPYSIQNHPSFSPIPIVENMSQIQESIPKVNPFGQASDSSFALGQYTPEEPQNTRVNKQPSQASVQQVDGNGSPDAEIGVLESKTEVNEDESKTAEARKDDVVDNASSTTAAPSDKDPGDEKAPINISDCGVVEPLETNTQDHGSEAHNKASENISLPGVSSPISSGHLKAGEPVSDQCANQSSPSIHGHSSDAHIKVGQYVSEVPAPLSAPNVHGHASDSHIKIGEHVSEVDAPLPSSSVRGHSSDAHIKIGENVSEFVLPVPSQNIHGHVSDAHIRVGELVSDVAAPLPSPSVHGHSSDAHIKVGENVSDFREPCPSPSVHGHASDANIKVGEFVSNIPKARPRWSKHGHSSDCTLQPGCVVSGAEPLLSPLPGSSYGHSSDSTLGVGCVVSGDEPKRCPLPGSAHGHSSDSSLGIGCVVSKSETLPSPLPGSTYGHSSDSTLGVGCVVLGTEPQPSPIPGSAYGHSSDSSLGVGCVVKGKAGGNQQKTKDNEDSKGTKSSKVEHTLTFCSLIALHLSTGSKSAGLREQLAEGMGSWAASLGLSPGETSEQEYLLALSAQYQVEHYEDCYNLMASSPECQLLKQVTRGPWGLPMDPTLRRATDTTAVQLSEMVSLPVLIKHSVTAPLITHVSLVNKAVVDYFFVELGVERHFEALRHFLLMEDGEFAQSLSDLLFEKLGSGQTPGELLTPLVLNSILSKALQYSLHGDTPLAGNFTFALRFLPETFHPHAPDSLNCLELRYKVDWPLNIIITDSCMNKYNRLFSFLLQLKHMVWSLRDVWFHLKRTALVKGAGRSVQFRQLQLYRHEMQHFVKVIQGYIANQILQVSWSEFTAKLATASDLDAIHRTHADYLNRAIFRGLLTEKAAPVMNIIHSIFSLILKFRAQLIAQPWDSQQGEAVHPSFIAMQQSYNTFKYYSHFLFKVVTKLVNRGYQPHLEDFLLRINFNNYYKDS
uniref:Gamma-tubulin complex component 6 n=1 Tax=Acanthochromis polyacanthus TaxID=80966 RepID=A0A3Q1FPF0_9TELE